MSRKSNKKNHFDPLSNLLSRHPASSPRAPRDHDALSHSKSRPAQTNPKTNPRTNPLPDRHEDAARLDALWQRCVAGCLKPPNPNPKTFGSSVDSTINSSVDPTVDPVNLPEQPVSRLLRIDADMAVVYAESAVWATRIRMQSPSLVACLRQSGLPELIGIRVRVTPPKDLITHRETTPAPLSRDARAVISQAAERNPDPELSERLHRLARIRQQHDKKR